jgi:uncharacterized surface protein with fasciclin (FAS1) repeats
MKLIRTASIAIALVAASALTPVIAAGHKAGGKSGHMMKKAQGDVVDVAAKTGMFKTLIAAAKAAGLVGALKGKGPITVFAPTDAAFAKLPKGMVAMLLKPENKAKLQAVLKHHVIAGKVMSGAIVKAGEVSAKSLNGSTLVAVATKATGKVSVNEANVIKANIPASNGVIHVIDTVMIPK